MYAVKWPIQYPKLFWIHTYVEKIKHGDHIYILILVRERDAEGGGFSYISTLYLFFFKKIQIECRKMLTFVTSG